MPTYSGHQPNTAGILGHMLGGIMPPKRRQKGFHRYEQIDPLFDLDSKIRKALIQYRNNCFGEDHWPKQGSEDYALLITYGLDEFIQGTIDEEDRFKKDWEGR